MFNINLLENLRVQISSRPPLVVFMVSVSATAIAFLTLGYFFKIKEIKSPERTEVGSEAVLQMPIYPGGGMVVVAASIFCHLLMEAALA